MAGCEHISEKNHLPATDIINIVRKGCSIINVISMKLVS